MNNILRFAADSLFKTNYTRYEHSDLPFFACSHSSVFSPGAGMDHRSRFAFGHSLCGVSELQAG